MREFILHWFKCYELLLPHSYVLIISVRGHELIMNNNEEGTEHARVSV